MSSASDFFCRGPSITLMMLSHVAGVGSLSNQLCNILDILTSSGKLELHNISIVLGSTPSRSPICCHLAVTEESNLSSTCFSGLLPTTEVNKGHFNKQMIFTFHICN